MIDEVNQIDLQTLLQESIYRILRGIRDLRSYLQQPTISTHFDFCLRTSNGLSPNRRKRLHVITNCSAEETMSVLKSVRRIYTFAVLFSGFFALSFRSTVTSLRTRYSLTAFDSSKPSSSKLKMSSLIESNDEGVDDAIGAPVGPLPSVSRYSKLSITGLFIEE